MRSKWHSLDLKHPLWTILFFQWILLVSLLSLTDFPLWLDEAYSALMARLSFSEIHQAMVYDAGPPLYYGLLHIWRAVWGEAEWALRSFSIVFSFLTTVVLYSIGARFFSRAAAIWACLLWILNPLSIYYALEVRNYTLFAAETVGLVYVLLRYLQDRSNKQITIFVLFGCLLIYTHNVGWFVLLSGVIAGVLYADGKGRQQILAAFGLVILLYIPWVPTLLKQMENTAMTLNWAKWFWSPWAIIQTLTTFIPGGFNTAYLSLPTLPVWGQVIVGAFLLLPIIYYLTVKCKEISKPFVVLILIIACTLVMTYLYSWIKVNIYLPGRTDFCILPFACLLLGLCIEKFSWKVLRYGIGAVLLTASIYVLAIYGSTEPPMSEREVVRYLSTQSRNRGIVLCTGLSRPAIEYYLVPRGFQIESYPKLMEDHLAHVNEAWLMSNVETKQEIKRILDQFESISDDQTYWIVGSTLTNQYINKPLFSALEAKGLASTPIQSPRMGLRKLNEPVFLMRIDPRKAQEVQP